MIFKSFLGIFQRIRLCSVSLRHDIFFFSWIQSNPLSTRRERSFLPLSGETKNSKEQTVRHAKNSFLELSTVRPAALRASPTSPQLPFLPPPPETANFSRLHLSFFLNWSCRLCRRPAWAMDEAMMSEDSIEMLVVTLLFDGEPHRIRPKSDRNPMSSVRLAAHRT